MIIYLLWFIPFLGISQLSPGPLTTAHEDLEGLTNCTQCHDIGHKVPDQKCLDCHSEISNLIDNQRGYHASAPVREKTCVDCHSEHHGRKFEMSRFDESIFNHELTGYTLQGQHAVIECRDCHQPDHIEDPELRKRSPTFLGLEKECLSCHDDFHQNTLSHICTDCHSFEAFRPADGFDHNEADFVLKGSHTDISCIECHPMELKNGIEFQVFKGLEFNSCVSCHDDVHKGRLNFSCSQCHTETSFKEILGERRFNHKQTNFNLNGRHQEINCFECHQRQLSASDIFQDKMGIEESNCVACHQDVHDGKFGKKCVECHRETSFFELKNMDLFNHNATDFPLIGLHQEVDCKACHTSKYTDVIDFEFCRNCHDDYHQGEFSEQVIRDCDECHLIEKPFNYSTFGIAEHQKSSFPLEGGHEATPCFACHVSEEKWSFRNVGSTCIDCHVDIHDGLISESYYPDKNCTACHSTETWATVSFDHQATEWPLSGQHVKTNCRTCHFESDEATSLVTQRFNILNQECAQCHANPHGSQFELGGSTACNRCHTSQDWTPTKFDHSTTAFPLEGKHTEIDCRACHQAQKQINGIPQTDYRIARFECQDCHG
jgi:hypothetical protein